MGLLAPLAEFILNEHKYKSIQGNVLFIGRQTVFLNEQTLGTMLSNFGLTNRAPGPIEYDSETLGARGQRLITDRYFMKSIGVDRVQFLDVTDYEHADVIHDLGYPIGKDLEGKFDFIYNGGCLDNMFNPGVALMNLSKLLRPGGRLICMESASSWNSPYLMYPPGWFYDYFVANGYADCKTYIAAYRTNEELLFGPWNWFSINMQENRNGPAPEADRGVHLLVLTVAEKASDSTSDKQPIQHQYRFNAKWIEEYDANELKIAASKRPFVGKAPKRYQYLTPAGVLKGTAKDTIPNWDPIPEDKRTIRRFLGSIRRNVLSR